MHGFHPLMHAHLCSEYFLMLNLYNYLKTTPFTICVFMFLIMSYKSTMIDPLLKQSLNYLNPLSNIVTLLLVAFLTNYHPYIYLLFHFAYSFLDRMLQCQCNSLPRDAAKNGKLLFSWIGKCWY